MCSTGSAWTLLQAGCPIRRSPDQRLLAATRGFSQQRYVLHRPLVPRHPPCALSSLTFLSSLHRKDHARCLSAPARIFLAAGARRRAGGDGRARTGDPLLAKQVLSQLSYIPVGRVVGLSGFEPETSRLSAVRSHQLS